MTEITERLTAWSEGDGEALGCLMNLVMDDLRRAARFYFEREDPGHTLQPTAIVNEVFLRLATRRSVQWRDRAQFFFFAGKLIRNILVDHSRRRTARKRGSRAEKVSLGELSESAAEASIDASDLIDLDSALRDLERLAPRAAQVVEMRYFLGLSISDTAKALELSPATVKRDWEVARLWLFRALVPMSA